MIPDLKQEPNLQYLKKLTTNIGIMQHSKFDHPDPAHGYSIDDCARALIVAYQIFETYNDKSILSFVDIYLGYLIESKIPKGYFHNFADKNDKFLDEVGSETSTGRAIWALGYAASRPEIDKKAAEVSITLLADLPAISKLKYIRSKAYALIGRYYINDVDKVNFLAESLVESYNTHKKYNWFEDELTYANGILPFSLFLAYNLTKKKEYLEIAEKSFEFLDKITRTENYVCPISCKGWKIGEQEKEIYDQQAIEPADMVLAAKAAKIATGKDIYDKIANDWLAWFFGNNVNHAQMIDKKNGACFDGIIKDGLNKNNGAESILCFLMAYAAMANDKLLLP